MSYREIIFCILIADISVGKEIQILNAADDGDSRNKDIERFPYPVIAAVSREARPKTAVDASSKQ